MSSGDEGSICSDDESNWKRKSKSTSKDEGKARATLGVFDEGLQNTNASDDVESSNISEDIELHASESSDDLVSSTTDLRSVINSNKKINLIGITTGSKNSKYSNSINVRLPQKTITSAITKPKRSLEKISYSSFMESFNSSSNYSTTTNNSNETQNQQYASNSNSFTASTYYDPNSSSTSYNYTTAPPQHPAKFPVDISVPPPINTSLPPPTVFNRLNKPPPSLYNHPPPPPVISKSSSYSSTPPMPSQSSAYQQIISDLMNSKKSDQDLDDSKNHTESKPYGMDRSNSPSHSRRHSRSPSRSRHRRRSRSPRRRRSRSPYRYRSRSRSRSRDSRRRSRSYDSRRRSRSRDSRRRSRSPDSRRRSRYYSKSRSPSPKYSSTRKSIPEILQELNLEYENEWDLYLKNPETHPDYLNEKESHLSFAMRIVSQIDRGPSSISVSDIEKRFDFYWGEKLHMLYKKTWEKRKNIYLNLMSRKDFFFKNNSESNGQKREKRSRSSSSDSISRRKLRNESLDELPSLKSTMPQLKYPQPTYHGFEKEIPIILNKLLDLEPSFLGPLYDSMKVLYEKCLVFLSKSESLKNLVGIDEKSIFVMILDKLILSGQDPSYDKLKDQFDTLVYKIDKLILELNHNQSKLSSSHAAAALSEPNPLSKIDQNVLANCELALKAINPISTTVETDYGHSSHNIEQYNQPPREEHVDFKQIESNLQSRGAGHCTLSHIDQSISRFANQDYSAYNTGSSHQRSFHH